jgi:NDP-sugar pyrophosphorylase family protein
MSGAAFFIPAGGEGQRLRPMTGDMPKPLLPVARGENGSFARIIDTPVAIAKALGKHTVVTGYYLADRVAEHFHGQSGVQTATDTGIVHIGGSMRQHRELVFQSNPDSVVMIPGDHYVPQGAINRLMGRLSSSGADVALLGTWNLAFHEQYPVTELPDSTEGVNLIHDPESSGERKIIGALGTYAFNATWLRRRLSQVPVSKSGHSDLTTDVVFGRDQVRPPHIVFEPLLPDEYWQDVGTVRRLFEHIRHLHPDTAKDEQGNVNLSDTPSLGKITDSVIYPGAALPKGRHTRSFIARNLVESYAE